MTKSKVSVLIALGFVALLVAAPANAQVNNMWFNAPFSFVAGDQALPAGPYQVTIENPFNLIQLRSLQEGSTTRVMLKRASVSRKGADLSNGLLTFRKYGSSYVLHGVWTPYEREGQELKVSRTEIDLAAADAARVEVAVSSALR